MTRPSANLNKRLRSLEQHLRDENPLLVDAVEGYRRLSKVGYALGLLGPDDSYATQIAWWPLISVLGTFSAGKSTFINRYLHYPLQDTGNQAVDDKFTVICYSSEDKQRVLPGLALDADPRFPFYKTSAELEKVAAGEGSRVDAYLQLKTCRAKQTKGRILIDSPGFDADAQRSATLRLTNHIVDLSDLVLVFFDARHPEPGAMSDTLAHLVRGTVDRSDSSKFLYILNQIDTAAREDNPEEVFGAWQRALAREGLTAGRFYSIYDPDAAVPIADPALRRRFEWKRDQDHNDILARIEQVTVERAYRIVGALEKRAREIEEEHVPRLRQLIGRWRQRVLRIEGGVLLALAVVLVGLDLAGVEWLDAAGKLCEQATATPWGVVGLIAALSAVLLPAHFVIRAIAARQIRRTLPEDPQDGERMVRAFQANTRCWRSIFERNPRGWNWLNRRRLRRVVADSNRHVQTLNDNFTDPSGKRGPVRDEPSVDSGQLPSKQNEKTADQKPEKAPGKEAQPAQVLSGEVIRPPRD
jgi:hypothetical protein